ncbi:MAG: hypothetical protein P8Y42_07055 [Exilibacterium sp.]
MTFCKGSGEKCLNIYVTGIGAITIALDSPSTNATIRTTTAVTRISGVTSDALQQNAAGLRARCT